MTDRFDDNNSNNDNGIVDDKVNIIDDAAANTTTTNGSVMISSIENGNGANPTTTNNNTNDTNNTNATTGGLSKNQLKKVRRWEKKMAIKKRRKEQDKEIKIAKAKAIGRDLDKERELEEERRLKGESGIKKKQIDQKWNNIITALQDNTDTSMKSFQVCLDCSYEVHMSAKEINSLALQIRYCYAMNKRSTKPCLLSATSLSGQTVQHLQKVDGFKEWSKRGFTCTADPLDIYYKDQIQNVVYLTSDSETTLQELDNNTIYVIGGIVDRNRLNRAAYSRATTELHVTTAKLPIDEYLAKMESTRVLTCNHVFEILLHYKTNGHNWEKALLDVLPHRKDAKSKSINDANDDDDKKTIEEEVTGESKI